MTTTNTIPQPTYNRVLATVIEADSVTPGGIILPDIIEKKTIHAEIVAVGPGVRDVAVGDFIIYNQYGVQELKYDGVDYILLKEPDVIAIVTED